MTKLARKTYIAIFIRSLYRPEIIQSLYLNCGIKDFNPSDISKQLHLSRKDVNWCLKVTSGTCLRILDYNLFTKSSAFHYLLYSEDKLLHL